MPRFFVRKLIFIFLFLFSFPALAQKDSISFFTPSSVYNSKRFNSVAITTGALYSGTMLGVYHLWYKGYPLESFHRFNDNSEWLQMDKVGHTTVAYYVGLLGVDVLKWTGVSHKRATIYGGMTGLFFLTTVEIFDGFAPKWGYSDGDMIANLVGTGLVIGQGLAWDEQRIKMKFSFHKSEFPPYRPNLLGKNLAENIMKDYNGQTYWVSANISSFLNENSRFPKWLNVAFGYSGEGMISGKENPADSNDPTIPYIKRYRQYYFSFDIDATRIKTKSRLLKSLFSTIGFIKIPAPAIEFNQGRYVKFRPFYF